MITLIDDPRHRLAEDGTARLSMEQAKAILDLRLQRLTALGGRDFAGARQSWRRNRTTRHPAFARPRSVHHQGRLRGEVGGSRPPQDRHHRAGSEVEDET